MAPRKRDDVHSAMIRKGFRLSDNDHHRLVYIALDKHKTSIWTKTSHGSSHRDISDDNLRKMARQCKLPNKEFARLLDCPLSQEEYEKILLESGQIAATNESAD